MPSNASATLSSLPPNKETASIADAQAGDQAALGFLYAHYVRRVYRYFYARVGNRLDAEDLTSRTFLSVVEGLPRYRHRGLFAAWLFTIARRKAIEHYRRRVPVTSIDELEVPSPASDPDVLAALAQDVDDLAGRIRDLNSSEQDLLRLRFAAQLSFKEVGAVVGKSEGATKKAIYRLLARLHDQMEDTHV